MINGRCLWWLNPIVTLLNAHELLKFICVLSIFFKIEVCWALVATVHPADRVRKCFCHSSMEKLHVLIDLLWRICWATTSCQLYPTVWILFTVSTTFIQIKKLTTHLLQALFKSTKSGYFLLKRFEVSHQVSAKIYHSLIWSMRKNVLLSADICNGCVCM